MRDLATMKATYLRKLTAIYAGTVLAPAIASMADAYIAQMTSLRDKQLLTKEQLNSYDIPGGRQAGFQMLCNKFWYLQTIQDYKSDCAVTEFKAALAYFTSRYAWTLDEVSCANDIAFIVFDVDVTLPPAAPPL